MFFPEKNIAELQDKHLVEKYKDKSELPKKLRIDASTICQLKCPVCYMRKEEDDAKKGCGFGFLKFDDFKKLLDENDFIESIELSNSGEIFLNPDLVKIIKYAYEKNVRLTANNGVNLNYLTDEQAEALAKYRFKSITISLDGASQETYSIYRIGGNFDKVIENIKKIVKYRKIYNNGCPHLMWKFIVFGHNEHEIDKVPEIAKSLGIDYEFDANWEETYSPVKNKEEVLTKTGLVSLNVNVSPLEQLKEFESGEIDWYFCKDLWDAPQINWDGRILGCCANFKEDFGGNVFKESLINALNHPIFIYAKNMLTNNAESHNAIPCSRCYIYKDMKVNNHWLTSGKKDE